MTIAPAFQIAQDDTHVTLEICIRHVRVRTEAIEVVLTDDNSVLHFAAPPIYLLVLNFEPYSFKQDDDESIEELSPTVSASFEPIDGVVQIKLEKSQAGVLWENLDLIGRLKQETRSRSKNPATSTSKWLKEIVDETEDTSSESNTEEVSPESNPKDESTRSIQRYGFGRLFDGIFTDLARDGLAKEMLEMSWTDETNTLFLHVGDSNREDAPKSTSPQRQRRQQRIQVENEKFSADRYVGDMDIENDYIYQIARSMKPHWKQDTAGLFAFTEQERLKLASIPYPLLPQSILSSADLKQSRALMLGLLDLLFAYVYDRLITHGDRTVESAWTVSILSASLSWLDDWLDDDRNCISFVVESSLRRALIYPYLRNFEFGMNLWKHVCCIMQHKDSIRIIIRCLLQLRDILDCSELYYLGNKLFVDPYLAWLQQQADPESLRQKVFVPLACSIEQRLQDDNSERLKDSMSLDLIKLEASLMAGVDESSDNSDSCSDTECRSSIGTPTDDDEDESSSLDSGSDSERMTKLGTDDLAKNLLELSLEQRWSSPLLVTCEGSTNDSLLANGPRTKAKSPLIQEVER